MKELDKCSLIKENNKPLYFSFEIKNTEDKSLNKFNITLENVLYAVYQCPSDEINIVKKTVSAIIQEISTGLADLISLDFPKAK